MTREQWIEFAGNEKTAVEAEESILSTGREFLPRCAIDVLNQKEPTPAYWDFLVSQLKVIRHEND